MSHIKDIEIALRDGYIAELVEKLEQDVVVLRKALRHIGLAEQMIDKWRETALEYREVAFEALKAYDEQSLELERLKRNG